MPQLQAYHKGTDTPVYRGEMLVDFRGEEWYFLYPSRVTIPGKSGKVFVIDPTYYDSSTNNGREFYADIFGLEVREMS